jgi:hypothetical protein
MRMGFSFTFESRHDASRTIELRGSLPEASQSLLVFDLERS